MSTKKDSRSPKKSSDTMTRLVDYFIVVGISTDIRRGGECTGVTIQRFPEVDWEDIEYTPHIEAFCQPQGWSLSTERQEPKFFAFVTTNNEGGQHYCACLSFYEPIAITPSKPYDEDEENDGSGDNPLMRSFTSGKSLLRMSSAPSHHGIMYAPKVLAVTSRVYQIEAFRHCLGTIYTVHSEMLGTPLETLVANLLGHIQVPPPGGPQIRFSIGGGDRQALQSPLNASIPITNTSVATLFQQLGINNVLTLFCALMTEEKILFHSTSTTRLTDACHGLNSLMYPFRNNHVYVPLLPVSLLELANSPTPFIFGILSVARDQLPELLDVIVVDLDGGSVHVPEGVLVSHFPEPYWSEAHSLLNAVLHPELTTADSAFLPLAVKSSVPVQLDKELRAIFMRVFAILLQGYRSCLVIIRIHPTPMITFHKAKFLGARGLLDNAFVSRLLNSMYIDLFIRDRGIPWRPTDLWDDLYNALPEQLKSEAQEPKLSMIHIQELAQQLALNEVPNSQPYVPKIVKPPEGAHTRIHSPVFPLLNGAVIQDIVMEGVAKQPLNRYNSVSKYHKPRIVPVGPTVPEFSQQVDNSARRLEVLRNCINCVFENKIFDARRSIHAVTRALKSHTAKLVLCQELSQHVTGNKAMLEAHQFDMVVNLMRCALQGNSDMDEHGVAAALLPLATSFCRKLCTGVIQFAYTCIQEHPVWKKQHFWESAFYADVEKDIKALYLPRVENNSNNNYSMMSNTDKQESPLYSAKPFEYSALDIAAEQIRIAGSIDGERMKELTVSEESTLYSQAIHYANRMVYLLVPPDTQYRRQKNDTHHHQHHHHNMDDERVSNITSMAESDSVGGESGFEEQDPLVESGTSVVKFVSRFVDKVCDEGGVTSDHIRALHSMIPGVVDMHIETLEAVYRESRRLPPTQKPKILIPCLLPGEEFVMEYLRAYLLPDGRENSFAYGSVLLPAEGALFITNYRLIFKGVPLDPLGSCEQIVIRTFPITSLTKEKRITGQYLHHINRLLQDGLQLRSSTFQLMKLAFDEEVTGDSVEQFKKTLTKLRHPPHIFAYFAFAGQAPAPVPLHAMKDKTTTIKGFAKKTLMLTARKAGLKPKHSKRQKYILRNWAQGNGGTLPASTKYLTGNSTSPLKQNPIVKDGTDGDEISLGSMDSLGGSQVSDDDYISPTMSPISQNSDSKSLERMMERSYYKDYRRMGLGSLTRTSVNSSASTILNRAESFRISCVNCNYTVCRTYPALVIAPNAISDDILRKVSRCYRGSRFPVITWKHPRTRALLLRSSCLNKGLMGMLRGQGGAGPGGSDSSAHLDQENFLRIIVNLTPLALLKPSSVWATSDSNLSLDSLLMPGNTVGSVHLSHSETQSPHFSHQTPDINRKTGNPFAKAMDTLRYGGTSGGKGMKSYKSWTALRPKKPIPIPPQTPTHINTPKVERDSVVLEGFTRLQKAALYIFGEKSHFKGVKTDSNPKIEYLPIEFPEVRQIRTSFKKLMRVCIPSNQVSTEGEIGFKRSVEATDWLQHLSTIMQQAGAIVNFMDMQGSSVMLCLEDGCDITSQLASIAQVCMDPYYRTLEGFQTLIEKEWLAFGHRFSNRNNMTGTEGPSSSAGFAPLFIQFLDVVHQIQKQFPLSFEFNEFYISFLAYHSVSARFRTFLVDNEMERVDYGFMAVDDKRGSLPRHYKGVDTGSDDEAIYMSKQVGSNSHQTHLGQSIFEYIEKMHVKCPIFFNFCYTKDVEIQILRPIHYITNLRLWDFFVNETLGTGAAYDIEVVVTESQPKEDEGGQDSSKDPRKSITFGYDVIENSIPHAFKQYLSEIHRLEAESGHLPQKWKQVWDKLELPLISEDKTLQRQTSMSIEKVRSHGRSIHKQSTVDLLLRGKYVRSTDLSSVFAHSHRFEKQTFTTLTNNCDNCSNILLGKVGLKCSECGMKCHEKCMDGMPKCLGKAVKSAPDGLNPPSTTNNTISDTHSIVSRESPSTHASHQTYYDQFHSNISEDRTHEGYLYKRGALLKAWKQRWFVLDSTKHQLRYYDAMEDSHSKGIIDLSEVQIANSTAPSAGAPKKADDRSFFEIRTTRRTYSFCASDAASAQEWVEKIQQCIC